VRKRRFAVALVLAAVTVPADASAGRPKRSGRFVVDRGRVRFQEKIRSRHRFVVRHDQGAGDLVTTVRGGKILRKGLKREIQPTATGTESRGEYFREGPFGVAHAVSGTDHVLVAPGSVREEVNKTSIAGRAHTEKRSTVAGSRGTHVEGMHGDRPYSGLDPRDVTVGRPARVGFVRKIRFRADRTSAADVARRQSLADKHSSSIFGEWVTAAHAQTNSGARLAVSRETQTSGRRRISRITFFHPGESTSEGTVEKHGRTVRRDQVRVSDRDGHRVEQYLRPNRRERKRIETWAGHDGVTTVVITRYRRNGSRWMVTTLRSDRDGAKKPERVFYYRDGITPRPPLFERD